MAFFLSCSLMKLLITPTSPYARKARIVLLEKQISCDIQPANPWENDALVTDSNPLRKVPVLITDAGDAVLDSRVICAYLDSMTDNPSLLPADPVARVAADTRVALAEGALDAALTIVMSGKIAPGMATPEWKSWLMDKVGAVLDYFAAQLPPASPDMVAVTLGCLLGTLDFRMPDYDWKSSRPQLAAYWQTLSARPSFSETVPREG